MVATGSFNIIKVDQKWAKVEITMTKGKGDGSFWQYTGRLSIMVFVLAR